MKTTKDINARNKELFIQMQTGDEHARERIFKLNERLISYILKKIYKPKWSYTYDDCVEAGQYGLLKAIDNFDLEQNIAFGSYATRCIENEILLLYRQSKRFGQLVSMDAPLKRSNRKDGSLDDADSLAVIIADKYDIQGHIEAREMLSQIEYAMRCVLTPLEQKIFSHICLIGDITHEEMCSLLKLSQARTTRLARQAKGKIERAIKEAPTFKGGIRKVLDGIAFWLPTKEMFEQMAENDYTIKANVKLLLKHIENADKDKAYEYYCKFLIGEISINEEEIKSKADKFSLRLQSDQDLRAFAKHYISVRPTKGCKIIELRHFASPPLSYEEISKELGIKREIIYTYYHNSLKTMLAQYEQHLSGQEKPAFQEIKRKNAEFVERLKHDADVQAFVKSYLPMMRPRLAEVFSLKYLTYPQPTNSAIAESLNITKGAVKTTLSRALAEIKTAYESQQE